MKKLTKKDILLQKGYKEGIGGWHTPLGTFLGTLYKAFQHYLKNEPKK